jgi:hypothetical protein
MGGGRSSGSVGIVISAAHFQEGSAMPGDSERFTENVNPTEHDTDVDNPAELPPGALQLYEAGKLTVVGFGGHDFPDEYCMSLYRDELIALIKEHQCEELAFDLTGVKLVPSGLLGIMASIYKQGVAVTVYNPSVDVRETLEVTRLNGLFQIREVDV